MRKKHFRNPDIHRFDMQHEGWMFEKKWAGPDFGPIMIMFHGGPWGPVIYGHAFRGYYPVLYKHVGLVWWDQYGCGRNHAEHVDETICVEDFAKMAVDLVDAVHVMFPDRKLILNGNSFGSYLALYAAAMRKDRVAGVICLGPICDMRQAAVHFENAAKVYYTAKEKAQVEALRKDGGIQFLLLVGSRLAEKYTVERHFIWCLMRQINFRYHRLHTMSMARTSSA